MPWKISLKSKISLRWPLFIISLVGIAFLAITIFFLIFNSFSQASYSKSLAPTSDMTPNLVDGKVTAGQSIISGEQAGSGLPVRLKIPAINVDTAIEPAGLTADGAMAVPKSPDDVAWFELGARPGADGSAVIAGHYGRWKNGQGSVFDDLNKLRAGDKLYVTDDQGATITFVVRASQNYDPKADAAAVFSSNDGQSHLNLVTCEGVWDKASKSYSQRLVVSADEE